MKTVLRSYIMSISKPKKLLTQLIVKEFSRTVTHRIDNRLQSGRIRYAMNSLHFFLSVFLATIHADTKLYGNSVRERANKRDKNGVSIGFPSVTAEIYIAHGCQHSAC